MRFGWVPRAVVYGSTDVVCNDTYQFLNNSLGQNPCLVYAYMVGSCATVFVQVEALNQSFTYPAPDADPNEGVQSASNCTCGRIPYNLISACAACQGKTVSTWEAYDSNCQTYDDAYNFTAHVPDGTALPLWATMQSNATEFDWDTALTEKGAGEILPSGSTNTTVSSTQAVNQLPTNMVSSPHAQSAVVSASVGLAVTAIVLTMLIFAAFLYFWKRIPARPPSYVVRPRTVPNTFTGEKNKYGEKAGTGVSRKGSVGGSGAGGRSRHASNSTSVSKGTGTGSAATPAASRASVVFHSASFSAVVFIAIITACLTTWTSVALTVGGVQGQDSQKGLLNFLVFASWWTFVGSTYLLLAFLHDRANRSEEGTYTSKRFGTLHGHLIWLMFTWICWMLGASLFAASIADQDGNSCQLYCTQLKVVPAFAFIELLAVTLILVVVIYSYFNAWRRSRRPKRLPQSQIHTQPVKRSTK